MEGGEGGVSRVKILPSAEVSPAVSPIQYIIHFILESKEPMNLGRFKSNVDL